MTIQERVKYNRDNYIAGKLNYIPLHSDFGILAEWYPGTMKSEYVGITGGTSSAKSQVTRRIYLYGAIEWAIKNKVNLKVKWFGLEESVEEARYYLLSWLLHKTKKLRYNIEHFEAIGKTVYEHDLKAIDEIQPIFDKFWAHIDFYDNIYTTTDIHDKVLEGAEARGVFYKDGQVVTGVNHKTQYDNYVANDKDEFVIVTVDHFGILEQAEGEGDDRKSMVRMSKIMRQQFCKRLNYISVGVIQQMMQMEDLAHIQANQVYASIQGFGDSKTIARDMMTIFGITNISRYGHTTALTSQTEIDGGKISFGSTGLGDFQRVIGILKRRYGIVNKRAMLLFDGCVGEFKGISQFSDIEDYVEQMKLFNDGFKS